MFKRIYHIALRECGIIRSDLIYLFSMVIFPLFIIFFFTSLLEEGQPEDMPVGVVDLDNSSTTRSMIRMLDAFKTSKVVAHYPNVNEARNAIQRNEIYAFLYISEGTTEKLLSNRRPKVSFYYNMSMISAGSLLFKDLKTISVLGSAGVSQAKLRAYGKTPMEQLAFVRPVNIDVHALTNPGLDYNVYLSTALIPACILLFIFLITAYSIGTELKFDRAKEWMSMSDNNILVAMFGKLLPQTMIFVSVILVYQYYIYHVLDFPHEGSMVMAAFLGILSVLAAQGFGFFAFGLFPSLRMSMSIGSLWASLSFSLMGTTFPVTGMDAPIQALTMLFPMRHYFQMYRICVLNGYPLTDAWVNILSLIVFACMPFFVLHRIKKAMLEYVYIP